MRRHFSTWLLVVTVFSTCLGADVRLEVENELRETLCRGGVLEGPGSNGHSMVVISSVSMEMSNDDLRGFVMSRQRGFRLAELRARAKILSSLSVKMSGGTSVSRGSADGQSTKTIATTVGLFADRELHGVAVEAFAEKKNVGEYALAVAYRWSAALERDEQKSMAGILRASDTWRREIESWLAKQWPGYCPPSMVFQDSAGFVHHIGVGYASLTGRLPQEVAVAAATAENVSRANLQLSMTYAQEMKKKAESLGRWDGNRDRATTSLYDFFMDIKASGPLVPFIQICDGVSKCPMTSSDVYRVVVAEVGVSGAPLRNAHILNTNPQADGSMMIFNPLTNKYEPAKARGDD